MAATGVGGPDRECGRRGNLFGVAVFAVSLLINLVVLWDYSSSPFSQVPAWDGEVYWKWAQDIAGGNWLGSSIFHQSPLYPYFLALLMALFGKRLFLVYLVQAVFSAASSWLVYSTVRKLNGNSRLALVGGLLFAFYGFQVYYATKILSETLALLLMLLATRLILEFDGERVPARVALGAGVAFGLLLTAKPHLLLALPCLLGYLFLVQGSRPLRALLPRAVLFSLPVLLILSLVAARNYAVGKDFVLISSNGGENFYIGNHENANGMYTYVAGISHDIKFQNEDVNAVARKLMGRPARRSEVSTYWFDKGMEFIKANPGRYLDLQLAKLKFIFSGAEVSSMYFRYFEKENLTRTFGLAFVNFYLIFPLFLAGCWAALTAWRRYFPLYCFLLLNMLNLLIFFYDTRFMLLVVPYLVMFGATGLGAAWQAVREAGWGKALTRPACLVLLVGVGLSALIFVKDQGAVKPDAHLYLALGDINLELDKLDAALDCYRNSGRLNQEDWTPAFGALKVCFRKGQKDLAAQLYCGALPALNQDLKREVGRDKELEALRRYVEQQGAGGAAAGAAGIATPQALMARVPERL